MKVKIDSEVIYEIRNVLQIIMGNAELLIPKDYVVSLLPSFSDWRKMLINLSDRPDTIIEQVKRIDGLLPQVRFEDTTKED